MKLIQILLSLAAFSFFGATATPASRTDRVSVYGLDGNSNKTDDHGPFVEIAKRGSICGGSSLCLFSPSAAACKAASGAYDDNTNYCGYTSRVSGHCTAMFYCIDHDECWTGQAIKESFDRIDCPVGQCGTETLDDTHNCRTEYNYCHHCENLG